ELARPTRMSPVFEIDDVREAAVERVAPGVEATGDGSVVEVAAADGEAGATVQARVVRRGDGVGRRTNDEDRLVADDVLDVVADRLQLFLATRDLPHPRPHAVHLEIEELARGVALLRDESIVADEHARSVVSCPTMEFQLADLFESVVDVVPDREAVECGERRMTYRELDESSNRVAHGLRAHGVGAGDHVGCYLHNSVEYVETMLGCLKIRAVPVNVNYRYVADELAQLFEEADLVALVFDRRLAVHVTDARRPDALRTLIEVEDHSPATTPVDGALAFDDVRAAGGPER